MRYDKSNKAREGENVEENAKHSEKETFVIQIQHHENATWQGTVEWNAKRKTKQFRSEVELIKLLDSALDAAEEQ